MTELPIRQPEQSENKSEAKQREAALIADTVADLWQAIHGDISHKVAVEVTLDRITDLCELLAKRDPELGSYLVDALESHAVTSTELDPAEQVRKVLGMPIPDYMGEARTTDFPANQLPPQPPTQGDHLR